MPTLACRSFLPLSFLTLAACPSGGETTEPPPPAPVIAATAMSGGTQSKTTNAASDPMVVKFTTNGAALPSATVAWTTTGGTLAATSTTTNAQGEATNTLSSVGPNAGTVTVSATSNGKSATFTITVTAVQAGPPASISFPAKVVALDSAGTLTAAAVVKDANGNVVVNPTVTYTSRTTGNATVNASGQITGVKSGQTHIIASVTSGTSTFTDSLVAVIGRVDGPAVFIELPRFDLKADTTFTVGVFADMRASSTKLGSAKITITWHTTALVYQSNAEGAGNVGATVNATNAATGTLTLAFANSTGFSGKTELRKLTFKAASTTAAAGTISSIANETYAAGTYADLLAKTVSVGLALVTR